MGYNTYCFSLSFSALGDWGWRQRPGLCGLAGSGAWPPAEWCPREHEVRSGLGARFPLGPCRATGVRLSGHQQHHVREQRSVSRHMPRQLLHIQDVALDRLLEV